MIDLIFVSKAIGVSVGVLKNGLDLFNSAKVLFRKKQIISPGLELKGSSKASLVQAYETIDAGKDMARKIFNKLCIYYLLFAVIISVALVILVPTFSRSLDNSWNLGASGVLSFLIVVIIFPSPLKVSLLNFTSPYLQGVTDLLISLEKKLTASTKSLQNVLELPAKLKRNFFPSNLIGGYRHLVGRFMISALEHKYLDRFVQLCAMRDALEAHLLIQKMGETRSHFFETFNCRVEAIIIDTLEQLITDGRLRNITEDSDYKAFEQKWIIEQELYKVGLSDFMPLLAPNFYSESFHLAYETDKKSGLKNILQRYWTLVRS